MSNEVTAGARFSAGAVLSRSASLMVRHLWPFFLLSATIFLPYLFVVIVLGGDPVDAPDASISLVVLMLLLTMVLSSLVTAVINHAVFQSLRSRPIGLGASLDVARQRIVPVVLLALLQSIGVAIGSVFLLIPGLVLLTVWYVAMPACVVERTGPAQSLGRSLELTRERRWPVFGIIVVMTLVALVVGMIVQSISLILGGVAGAVLMFAWQALFSAVYAITVTVTYYDLRVEKEGVDIDSIAELFA